MEISLRKRDAIWSYLGVFMSMGVSFMLLPFVLLYLDSTSIGLYYIFISLGALANLFDFGFNPAFARNVAYSWSGATVLKHKGGIASSSTRTDYKLFQDVLSACRYVYHIISSLTFVLILVFGGFYISYITQENSGNDPIVAWVIFAVSLFLNLYFGYYAVFLRGVGAIAEINKATIFARIIQILVTITLLVSGLGLIGTSIGYLLYGVSFRLYAKRQFFIFKGIGNELKKSEYRPDKKDILLIVKTIWYNAWRDGLVSVSSYLLGQAGTIISSLFLTLEATGIYSLSVQITAAIATIAATFNSMNQPVLQSAYINGNEEKQKGVLSFNILSFIFLFSIGMIFLFLIGIPIIQLIKPSYTISVTLIIFIGVYQLLQQIRNCYSSYLSTTNRVIYFKAFIISAILCIALELFFTGIFELGVFGIVMAQIISQLVYNIWKWPIFVHRELKLSLSDTVMSAITELKTFLNM